MGKFKPLMAVQVQIEVLEAHAADVQSSLLQMDTDIGQIGHSTRLGDRIQASAQQGTISSCG